MNEDSNNPPDKQAGAQPASAKQVSPWPVRIAYTILAMQILIIPVLGFLIGEMEGLFYIIFGPLPPLLLTPIAYIWNIVTVARTYSSKNLSKSVHIIPIGPLVFIIICILASIFGIEETLLPFACLIFASSMIAGSIIAIKDTLKQKSNPSGNGPHGSHVMLVIAVSILVAFLPILIIELSGGFGWDITG